MNGSTDLLRQNGQVFFYFGENVGAFREVFSKFGLVVTPAYGPVGDSLDDLTA